MAAFNLTAKLRIQSPTNLSAISNEIRNKLGNFTSNVKLNVDDSALRKATQDANSLSRAYKSVATNAVRASAAVASTKKSANEAGDAMFKFGEQSRLAFRRFSAFALPTSFAVGILAFLKSGVTSAVAFEREMVKLQQVTGRTKVGLQDIDREITRLSTSFGVSSKELVDISVTLAQAGLTAKDTKTALEALAKTTLTATFNDVKNTTEGVIAAMQQFGLEAKDMEGFLGSLNTVSAAFAVESEDLVSAIRKTGGVFKAAGGNVQELLALFTSVRQTTRESADAIATGFRTIFARIQRPKTIDFLREFNVELTDAKGNFVGPLEAIRALGSALQGLESTSPTFAKIVEEIGGIRQLSRVIPLIQQTSVAERALTVAQQGQNSLSIDAAKAQQSLAVELTKVKEQFESLFRTISNDSVIRTFITGILELTKALTKLAETAAPILPIVAGIGLLKVAPRAGSFAKGLFGRPFNTGGHVPGVGNSDTVPAMLTPGEFVLNAKAVREIGVDNLKKVNNRAIGRFNKGGLIGAQSGLITPGAPQGFERSSSGLLLPSGKIEVSAAKIEIVSADFGPRAVKAITAPLTESTKIIQTGKGKNKGTTPLVLMQDIGSTARNGVNPNAPSGTLTGGALVPTNLVEEAKQTAYREQKRVMDQEKRLAGMNVYGISGTPRYGANPNVYGIEGVRSGTNSLPIARPLTDEFEIGSVRTPESRRERARVRLNRRRDGLDSLNNDELARSNRLGAILNRSARNGSRSLDRDVVNYFGGPDRTRRRDLDDNWNMSYGYRVTTAELKRGFANGPIGNTGLSSRLNNLGASAGAFNARAGNFLKGPGGLIAAAGTEIVGNKLINLATGPDDVRNVNGSAAKSALSGAVAGASVGGVVGSIIPGVGTAVGAALGGAVGGITGFVSGLKDAKKELSEFNLAELLDKNSKLLNELPDKTKLNNSETSIISNILKASADTPGEGFNAVSTNIFGGKYANSSITSNLSTAEQAKTLSTGSQGLFGTQNRFTGVFGGDLLDVNSVRQAQSTIGKTGEAGIQAIKILRRNGKSAADVTNSPLGVNTAFSLGIAQQNIGDRFGQERVAKALIAKQAVDSGTDPKTLSLDLKLAFDAISGAGKRLLETENEQIDKNRKLADILNSLNSSIDYSTLKFAALSESLGSAVAVLDKLGTSQTLRGNAINGGIGGFRLTDSDLGAVDFSSQLTGQNKTNIANITGRFGQLGAEFGGQATDLVDARNLAAQALSTADPSLATNSAALTQHFESVFGNNRFGAAIGARAGATPGLLQEFQANPLDVLNKLVGEEEGQFGKTLESLRTNILEGGNKVIEAFDYNAKLIQQVGEKIDRSTLLTQEFNLTKIKDKGGIPTLSDLTAASDYTQDRLTGFKGIGLNPKAIDSEIRKVTAEIEQVIKGGNGKAPLDRTIPQNAQYLSSLQVKQSSLLQAEERLINSNDRLTAVNTKLAEAEAKRASVTNLAERLSTGTAQEKASALREVLAAKAVQVRGGFGGAPAALTDSALKGFNANPGLFGNADQVDALKRTLPAFAAIDPLFNPGGSDIQNLQASRRNILNTAVVASTNDARRANEQQQDFQNSDIPSIIAESNRLFISNLQTSIGQLNGVFTNFGNTASSLSASLDRFPQSIDLTVNEPIQVNINGAQALAEMEPGIRAMVQQQVGQAIHKQFPDAGPLPPGTVNVGTIGGKKPTGILNINGPLFKKN